MKKIKVIRIIDRLNIGGPAIHSILLTAGLNKKRFETILITGKICEFEGDMGYLATENGVQPIFIPELSRDISIKSDLIALWKIMKIIKKEKPDIIHTHKSKAGAIGRLASIFLRVPVIIHTFHGHVFHSYFGKLKSKIFLQIERILAYFTTKIIVISENQFNEICNIYRLASPKKFKIIPLGFDFSPLMRINEFKGVLKKEFNINESTITVGIIGRLTYVKNHNMFLKVAQIVLNQRKNVKFLIIGDGELKEKLIEQAKSLGIDKDIIFTGWIKSLPKIYSDLDIVTLTSFNEGTPVTIIEAMFCKKPVVTTNVGGISDLVIDKKTGYLIKKNDVENFSKALIELIDDPIKRSTFGENSFEYIKEKYSKERLIKDIEELYFNLTEKN